MLSGLSAMESCFTTSSGTHRWRDTCAMSRDLGFCGLYLAPEDTESAASILERHRVARAQGLEITGLYLSIDIVNRVPEQIDRLRALLQNPLSGPIELALYGTEEPFGIDTPLTAEVLKFLDSLDKTANGIDLRLYPHVTFWLERLANATELADRLPNRRFDVAFGAMHWQLVNGGHPAPILRSLNANGRLASVNICGLRKVAGSGGLPFSIEPLDSGEFDNFTLLACLDQLTYRGPIILQGYSVGGDVYSMLRRSMRAYLDICARIEAHAAWSVPEANNP